MSQFKNCMFYIYKYMLFFYIAKQVLSRHFSMEIPIFNDDSNLEAYGPWWSFQPKGNDSKRHETSELTFIEL